MDAGRCGETFWGVFVGWRYRLRGPGAGVAEKPVRLLEDNAAVAAKLRSGNPRGRCHGLWEAMVSAADAARDVASPSIRLGRSWDNDADRLAGPHEDAERWVIRDETVAFDGGASLGRASL